MMLARRLTYDKEECLLGYSDCRARRVELKCPHCSSLLVERCEVCFTGDGYDVVLLPVAYCPACGRFRKQGNDYEALLDTLSECLDTRASLARYFEEDSTAPPAVCEQADETKNQIK